jgi:dihydroflavonol-4-reductase
MRVFLTGATGFLGSEVARLLCERGDRVRALVRDRRRADELLRLGCEVVEGDLCDEPALVEHCRGVSAVVHTAAVHDIGVSPDRREAMVDVNVTGTERVLGAALSAGVGKAVLVSSLAVFGDTHGRVADERWQRDAGAECGSAFEQTCASGQRRAREISSCGLPLVVVQSGQVYGPGEPRALLGVLASFLSGRLGALPFPELGVCPVHRDDLAAGVLLALDKGTPGESYVLAGEPVRLGEVLRELADVSGRRPPTRTVPTGLLRALVPAGPLVSRALGLPPNLRELVRCTAGATYWASSDKAMDELGWTPRPLRAGLSELVAQH